MSNNDDVDSFFADMLAEENKKIRLVQSTLNEKQKKATATVTNSTSKTTTAPTTNTTKPTTTTVQSSSTTTSQTTTTTNYVTNGTPIDLLTSMQRDINSLTSHDRSVRISSIQRLSSHITHHMNDNNDKNSEESNTTATTNKNLKNFLFPHMFHQLLKVLSNDTVESCREQSAIILLNLLSSLSNQQQRQKQQNQQNLQQQQISNSNEDDHDHGVVMQDEWLSYLIPVLSSRLYKSGNRSSGSTRSRHNRNNNDNDDDDDDDVDMDNDTHNSAGGLTSLLSPPSSSSHWSLVEPSEEVRLILCKILLKILEKSSYMFTTTSQVYESIEAVPVERPISPSLLNVNSGVIVGAVGAIGHDENDEKARGNRSRTSELLLNYLDDVTHVIKYGFHDFYQIKIIMCQCTIALCRILPVQISALFTPTLLNHLVMKVDASSSALLSSASSSLASSSHNSSSCLTHQRSLVREWSVRALNELVLCGAVNGGSGSARDKIDVSIESMFSDGVLRQLMVDSSSNVRRIMNQCVRNWAICWSDRWSYQFQFAYLAIVSLTDEIQSIQLYARDTIDMMGQLFESDNEQEANDIRVYDTDYRLKHYEKLPLPEPYHQRPNLGCRMLVAKHARKMIDTILEELSNWNIPKRLVAARVLQRIIVLCESGITQHLNRLVAEYFNANGEDELSILNEIQLAVRLTGYFVEPETYIPMVWSYLRPEYATSPVLVSNVLQVFSLLLQGTNPNTVNWPVLVDGITTKLMSCHFVMYGDSHTVKQSCLQVIESLLTCFREHHTYGATSIDVGSSSGVLSHAVSTPMFILIVKLCAQRGISKQVAETGVQLLDQIRALKQLSTVAELYQVHFQETITEITRDVASWDKTSPNLYSFEALIRHGPQAAVSHFDLVLRVLKHHITEDVGKDLLSVVLVLFAGLNGLLAHVASRISREQIGEIVRSLIAPNLVWKIGPLRAQIRKAAVACLSCILRQNAIAPDDLPLLQFMCSNAGSGMLVHLRACYDSDEDIETRIITIKLFQDLIPLVQHHLVDEQWEAITKDFTDRQLEEGVELLSKDSVRVLHQIILLVPCHGDVVREKSIVELIVSALVLHMDTPTVGIRTAIYHCLSDVIQRAVTEKAPNYAEKREWILNAFRNKAEKAKRVVRDCGQELTALCNLLQSA